jgi:hypothetical protein
MSVELKNLNQEEKMGCINSIQTEEPNVQPEVKKERRRRVTKLKNEDGTPVEPKPIKVVDLIICDNCHTFNTKSHFLKYHASGLPTAYVCKLTILEKQTAQTDKKEEMKERECKKCKVIKQITEFQSTKADGLILTHRSCNSCCKVVKKTLGFSKLPIEKQQVVINLLCDRRVKMSAIAKAAGISYPSLVGWIKDGSVQVPIAVAPVLAPVAYVAGTARGPGATN